MEKRKEPILNEQTEKIIRDILTDERAWDKKTRKLRLFWVIEQYQIARELLWMNTVYFRRFDRAVRLIESWKLLPPDHFEDLRIDENYSIRWITCSDCLDIVQRHVDDYFEHIWYSPDWQWQEITEQDILNLGIRPSIVPAKPGQPSLF
jgi:hypothetical protein